MIGTRFTTECTQPIFSYVDFQDEKPVEAIRICSEVLQMEPDNVNALKDRAEAYLIEEMYDEGKS